MQHLGLGWQQALYCMHRQGGLVTKGSCTLSKSQQPQHTQMICDHWSARSCFVFHCHCIPAKMQVVKKGCKACSCVTFCPSTRPAMFHRMTSCLLWLFNPTATRERPSGDKSRQLTPPACPAAAAAASRDHHHLDYGPFSTLRNSTVGFIFSRA